MSDKLPPRKDGNSMKRMVALALLLAFVAITVVLFLSWSLETEPSENPAVSWRITEPPSPWLSRSFKALILAT